MFNVNTFGSKLLVVLFAFFAGLAVYLPFLEAFALTPAIAFVHRFSITLQIGSLEKTLQPILFVIPILFIKGAIEYNKRYGITSLVKNKIVWLVLALLLIDLVSVATSSLKSTSFVAFAVHAINIMVFLTSSIWLRIVIDMLQKPNLQKAALRITKTFIITLAVFTITNAVVSISQFADCSFSDGACHLWKSIDTNFPNRLLEVGHQKFSYESPIIARAPGFFGDVNFNGMFSLFILVSTTALYFLSEVLKTKKGYSPIKEQRILIAIIVASTISFLLTFSRSALLGAGILTIVLFFAFILPLLKNIELPKLFWSNLLKISAVATTALVLTFLIGFAIPLQGGESRTSISGKVLTYIGEAISIKDSSANGHLILFQDALKLGSLKPIFGHGIGTYSPMYQKFINPADANSNPHSTYAMLYAEQGIVGLVVYLVVIILFWIIAINTIRKTIREIAIAFKNEKKLSKEFYMTSLVRIFLALICFGIPFYSIATTTYYGFFLPMTWWWGMIES